MSPQRLKLIQDAVGEKIEILPGDKEAEGHQRYHFAAISEPPIEAAKRAYYKGEHILWVCNRVGDAQALAGQLKREGYHTLLYHSRFAYMERKALQTAVINAFKSSDTAPVIAVATQVCEVSLDLKYADLLICQVADPAALIQRLGRLNRVFQGMAKQAIFYPDKHSGFPYSAKDLKGGDQFVTDFLNKDCSQAELAEWLNSYQETVIPDVNCQLLDLTWQTYPASQREAGYTEGCLLEVSQDKWNGVQGKALQKYVVPLLISEQMGTWAKYQRFKVAPSQVYGYDKFFGAFRLGGN